MADERGASRCVVDAGRVGCGRNGNAASIQNGDFGNGHFSEGSSSIDFRTYKRRKNNNLPNPTTELLQMGKPFTYLSATCQDKMVKEQRDKVDFLTLVNDAENGHQLKCPRNIVLDQVCKSISETGGTLRGCLKDILSQTGSSCKTADKTINGLHNAGEVHIHAMPNRLPSEANCSITELGQQTFVDILMSEKFAQLCSLLMENFSGMRVDEFFDIKNINSRIENGTYENSPILFHADIKQLWSKVQNVGTQMASLANCLMEKSTSAFHEHVAGSVPEVCKHEKQVPSKEQNDASSQYFSCRHCGEHADGKDCLVCDFCEEMYHIFCIEPAVKEIPTRCWYCSKCTMAGIQQPHCNCVVCERLNAADTAVRDNLLMTNKRTKFEENSNNSDDGLERDENLNCCSICRGYVENSQDLKVCGHVYCPHKYYHARCLTGKQLNTHGPCWYCPSCLCLTCLLDRDDDKIVLCDGCDHAYHIYCTDPPLDTVPEGKWFCRKCNGGIQKIQRVRRAFKIMQSQSEMKCKDRNLKISSGVDMLFNAAETLDISSNKSCDK